MDKVLKEAKVEKYLYAPVVPGVKEFSFMK